MSQAGSLTPPGAPAPTMKTLAEVEPRTPISSIPITISEFGSYYLTGNLTGLPGTNGITIISDSVTIDLNGFALIGGQRLHGAIDIAEFDRGFLRAFAAYGDARLLADKGLQAAGLLAALVDPDIAHDPIHPAIEPRADLPARAVGERAFDCHLTEIVTIGRIAGQPDREATQPGQQGQQVFLERGVQCLCLPQD